MTFKLLRGGRLLTMGLGVGLAWACAVSDKKDFTFDDSPDSGGRGGSSAAGGKGGKSGSAGSAGRGAGGSAGRAGSGPLAGEAGEAGQAGQGQGGAEGGSAGTSGKGGKGGTGGLPPCDTGEKRCNGACIDILANDDNCGDCGTECDSTHFCQAGSCELDCRSNEEICDGVCIDTTSDHDHCGDCNTACTSREVCNMGSCSLDCGGLTNCSGACVDLTNSAQHCGNCDTTCTGNTECVSSMCGCTGGATLCMPGGNPTCIDTDSDPNNCGDCEQVCNLTNAASGCSGGSCTVVSCINNTADCNRMAGDGCEVDRDIDEANCGACGMACNLANSVEQCVGGVCGIASCSGSYEDCNRTVGDGCEVDTDSDLGNCGGCNQDCDLANASESCSNGTCTLGSCTGAFRNCNSMPGDGCEINSNTDPAHCGGCGAACNLANATAGCSGGSCTVASCTGAFRNCNSMPGDGCEINSNTNPAHCGGCGAACNLANATAGCSGGSCTVASCTGAFRNCNSMPGDGCEINTNTDANNCGGCGNACGAGISCVGGVCQDPCMSFGGTRVVINSNIRVCNTPVTYGSWSGASFPSGWGVCTVNQWAAYAPSVTPASMGATGGNWIESTCPVGSSCESGGSRPWIYDGYLMDRVGCYLGDECYNSPSATLQPAVCTGAGYSTACNTIHRELTDSTRLQSFTAASPNYCDNSTGTTSPDWFGAGWYRFWGAAGTRIATTDPGSGNCATDAAGYMTGGFPTTAAGLVTRQVCYSWSGNTCFFPNDIQVVNCGGFTLYNLPLPTACSYRYCGAP